MTKLKAAVGRANALVMIRPYKEQGTWMFDDPSVGLVREPFVCGVPEIIERATAHIPNAERGFTAVFSAHAFPSATFQLELVREEMGGAWYREPESELEGWLCPALFKYFDEAPGEVWVEVRG